jgi:general secretion pathway protein L
MSLHDLGAAFRAWINSAALILNDRVSSVRAFNRARLTEEENGTFSVEIAGGCKRAGVHAPIRIAEGAVIEPLSKQTAAAIRGSQIELVLRSDRFLHRPLDLPKRADEFLDGIVRSQIDRLTPWTAADAAFGWTRPTEIAKERISLTVIATSRTHVTPYVQALSAIGARAIAISTVPPAAKTGGPAIEILRQRGAAAFDIRKIQGALVVVLLLAVLSMCLAIATDLIFGSVFEAQKSDILQRVADRRSTIHRDGIAADPSAQIVLARRKHETPSSVMVLEALSRILPDHTYATELRVERDKLQVMGITRDAPALIRLIEQSPHFARAAFFAPTTRSPGEPGDRFHIEARIMPVFTVH